MSILCATYRHVDFIHAAIGGFLAQLTTFPFEIIIRDDASDDGTAEIVQQYASQYPAIITAIIEEHNTYRQKSPLSELRKHAKGEFIALCDGDDYWISPDKIERQVAILRDDVDAVLSYHDYVTIKNGVIEGARTFDPVAESRVAAEDLRCHRLYLHTCTLLYRNLELPNLHGVNFVGSGDVYLQARLGLFGDAVHVPQTLSAYRHHSGGVYSLTPETNWNFEAVRTFAIMSALFHQEGDFHARDRAVEMSVVRLAGPGARISRWTRVRLAIYLLRESLFGVFRR